MQKNPRIILIYAAWRDRELIFFGGRCILRDLTSYGMKDHSKRMAYSLTILINYL
jgi:hypothetical protein